MGREALENDSVRRSQRLQAVSTVEVGSVACAGCDPVSSLQENLFGFFRS